MHCDEDWFLKGRMGMECVNDGEEIGRVGWRCNAMRMDFERKNGNGKRERRRMD